MEDYSTINRNILLIHVPTWMNLKTIMLSKSIQPQSLHAVQFYLYVLFCFVLFCLSSGKKKTIGRENYQGLEAGTEVNYKWS